MTVDWEEVEALYEKLQLPPQVPSAASRVAVPVYRDGTQVGKATSTTWSPVLKKMIALATVERGAAEAGSRLEIEVTVEAVRHRVGATVTPTPFFNPPRKTARLA
jgi:aminomethyltransferase